MNRAELFEVIISKATDIVNEKGLLLGRLNGKISFDRDFIEFKDEIVSIRKDPNTQELEIIKNDNKNPVLCCAPDGKIYRSHGEIRYIQEHILNL